MRHLKSMNSLPLVGSTQTHARKTGRERERYRDRKRAQESARAGGRERRRLPEQTRDTARVSAVGQHTRSYQSVQHTATHWPQHKATHTRDNVHVTSRTTRFWFPSTATHCITLYYTALYCITLHYTALHCNTTHRNTLQHVSPVGRRTLYSHPALMRAGVWVCPSFGGSAVPQVYASTSDPNIVYSPMKICMTYVYKREFPYVYIHI